MLVYVPSTGDCHVLATGIRFANGVGVSKDGRHIYVASTSTYKIFKVPTVPSSITFDTAPRPIPAERLELFHPLTLGGLPGALLHLVLGLPVHYVLAGCVLTFRLLISPPTPLRRTGSY